MNDRIVSSLVGLVGACANNGKTENTDSVILWLRTCRSYVQRTNRITKTDGGINGQTDYSH